MKVSTLLKLFTDRCQIDLITSEMIKVYNIQSCKILATELSDSHKDQLQKLTVIIAITVKKT